MKATKFGRARSACAEEHEPLDSNPAIASLMANQEQDAKERDAWLEANQPRVTSNYGGFEYSGLPVYYRDTDVDLQLLTVNYLKGQYFDPAAKSTWRDYAVEAAKHHAGMALQHLQRLACGADKEALAALADLAVSATETLTETARRAPASLRPVARRRFLWPFLKAPRERFGDNHKELVKRIELGQDLPFSKEAAARVRPTNVAVRTAMSYLCGLEEYRKPPSWFGPHPQNDWQQAAAGLEPFSSRTWREWSQVAWQALSAEHGGHPERESALRKIGLYRAKHYPRAEHHRGTHRTTEYSIREGIKFKFEAAVKRLAGAGRPPKN